MYEQYLYECDCDDQAAYEAQCDGEVEALAQQEADAAEAEHSKLKMINHIKDCSYCTFQEFDSCNCLISEKSGYEFEEERNFNDDGYDGWLPCRYYLKWEDAIDILIRYIDEGNDQITNIRKLLPCPFCGGNNVEIYVHSYDCPPDLYSVDCNDCGGGIELFDTRNEVIEKWNNRRESGELPEWLKQEIKTRKKQIINAIDYYSDKWTCEKIEELNWVLSLKKPEGDI
jgi:Lar family restriction alleviation protein